MFRKFHIFILVLGLAFCFTNGFAHANNKIYWTDSGAGEIRRANLDGSNVEDIITGVVFPEGIAITGDKMYFVHDYSKIRRANLDGSNAQDIITELAFPVDIAITGGKMYWTEHDTNRIQRANLDGSNVEDIITELGLPASIALASDKMYWINVDAGKIQRANLDGSNVEDIITDTLLGTLGVAGGKIYWSSGESFGIRRANLDGSNVQTVITDMFADSIALDVVGSKMYWTWSEADGTIRRANLDGSNVEDIIYENLASDIALVNIPQPSRSITFNPPQIADQTFTVGTSASLSLPIATGGTAPYTYSLSGTLPSGLRFYPHDRWIGGTPTAPMRATTYTYTARDATGTSASLRFTIGVTGARPGATHIYWTNLHRHRIQRANLDGSNIEDIITGVENPQGIALDIAGGKIYWSNSSTDKIQRANFDGSNIEDIITGVSTVSIAMAGGKMYWADYNAAKIRHANLDGSNVEDIIIGVEIPVDIALDIAGGKIYWTDNGTRRIQRANLDGSNVQDIITGVETLGGIALDIAGGKMYWIAGTAIQHANLDGSNIQTVITGLPPEARARRITLDVADDRMYWAAYNTIQRANLDGSNIQQIISGADVNNIALSIPEAPGTLTFSPNTVADQTFTVGTSASLSLPIATGGTAPYTYSLSGTLPAGLRFEPLDRWIGGTPTAPMDTTTYVYTARDATGETMSLIFTITVKGAPGTGITFTPADIADQTFTVGSEVSLRLPAPTGGTRPYTYTLTPALPAGLYFDPFGDSYGFIGGTPTTATPATPFIYTVRDAAGTTASLTFTITVTPTGTLAIIEDPVLAAAIRRSLGVPTDTRLTAALLQQLTTLDAYAQGVTTLSGLEQATNLITLDLGANRITDISVLAHLTQLEQLYLDDNQITDVSPLAGLTNLRLLRLLRNPIRDTSPLAALLRQNPHLDIDIPITAPPPATGVSFADANLEFAVRETLGLGAGDTLTTTVMLGLVTLEAYDRRIASLSGLEHAKSLLALDLGKNQIVDVSPLSGLTALEVLYLDDNQITDVSPLAGLTNLEMLFLQGNPITSLAPISDIIGNLRVFRHRLAQ